LNVSNRKPYVGGNWKMNTTSDSAISLARGVCEACEAAQGTVDVVVFPPSPYLIGVASIFNSRSSAIRVGAQDLYHEAEGAFTGEVSVGMGNDCGCEHALAGHSERRHVIGESDGLINAKVKAMLSGGLTCVLCVGELLEERDAGKTNEVNERQLRTGLAEVGQRQMDNVVIAYEPVWAIGTGKTASPEDAQAAHAFIRSLLVEMYNDDVANRTRIIYGGSVKPSNAATLFAQPDIDGGLIGGASLKIEDFAAIVKAAAGV
jgi:triosephosphate isomerase